MRYPHSVRPFSQRPGEGRFLKVQRGNPAGKDPGAFCQECLGLSFLLLFLMQERIISLFIIAVLFHLRRKPERGTQTHSFYSLRNFMSWSWEWFFFLKWVTSIITEEGVEEVPTVFSHPLQNSAAINSSRTQLWKVLAEHSSDVSFQAFLKSVGKRTTKQVSLTPVLPLWLAWQLCWRGRRNSSNTTSNCKKKKRKIFKTSYRLFGKDLIEFISLHPEKWQNGHWAKCMNWAY